jgi:agmatinase
MLKLLGVPYDHNSSFLKGAAFAPSRIRLMDKDGSSNVFSQMGLAIEEGINYVDSGDLIFKTTDPLVAFQHIKASISLELNHNHKLICLGGDHSISYPIIDCHAQKYEGLNILQIDAHGDLYENFDNNLYSHASPFARLMETGIINSLTQVGIRAINTHQREQIDRYKVNTIEMKDFNFDFISTLKPPLYISLDLDGLDPAFAPGVSHHEPGGLSTREVIKIIHSIPFPVIGADIVEYNPTRDINNMTAMVAYSLFKELAHKILS